MRQFPKICCLLMSVMLLGSSTNVASAQPSTNEGLSSTDLIATLNTRSIDARDLKTLHYMENAHGQLEQWSKRLLSRLENDMGPRDKDPILDGRADLQVQKIAITYASYTRNDALGKSLRHLAKAHRARLTALQTMVEQGPDREQFNGLSTSVTELVNELRIWSEKR